MRKGYFILICFTLMVFLTNCGGGDSDGGGSSNYGSATFSGDWTMTETFTRYGTRLGQSPNFEDAGVTVCYVDSDPHYAPCFSFKTTSNSVGVYDLNSISTVWAARNSVRYEPEGVDPFYFYEMVANTGHITITSYDTIIEGTFEATFREYITSNHQQTGIEFSVTGYFEIPNRPAGL